ncbi:MAG: hypothetical protein HY459_02800 [Parcubacteria group bacterium]|nr:hypothetical protein [Parcubacteria group bacterium]
MSQTIRRFFITLVRLLVTFSFLFTPVIRGTPVSFAATAAQYTNNNAPLDRPTPNQAGIFVLDITLRSPDNDALVDADGTATTGAGTSSVTAGTLLFDVAAADLVVADSVTAPTKVWRDVDNSTKYTRDFAARTAVGASEGDVGAAVEALTNAKVSGANGVMDADEGVYVSANATLETTDTVILTDTLTAGTNVKLSGADGVYTASEVVVAGSANGVVDTGDVRATAYTGNGGIAVAAKTQSGTITASAAHNRAADDVVKFSTLSDNTSNPFIVSTAATGTTLTVVGAAAVNLGAGAKLTPQTLSGGSEFATASPASNISIGNNAESLDINIASHGLALHNVIHWTTAGSGTCSTTRPYIVSTVTDANNFKVIGGQAACNVNASKFTNRTIAAGTEETATLSSGSADNKAVRTTVAAGDGDYNVAVGNALTNATITGANGALGADEGVIVSADAIFDSGDTVVLSPTLTALTNGKLTLIGTGNGTRETGENVYVAAGATVAAADTRVNATTAEPCLLAACTDNDAGTNVAATAAWRKEVNATWAVNNDLFRDVDLSTYYRGDKLSTIAISNAGTALDADISKISVYEDDATFASWNPANGRTLDETLIGSDSATPFLAQAITLSSATVFTASTNNRRIFVTMDIAPVATNNRTIQAQLAVNSVVMVGASSTGAGPSDAAVTNSDTQTVYIPAAPPTGSADTPAQPLAGTPEALSTTSIRWKFTDRANNENGFRIHNASHAVVATSGTSAVENLSSLDETGLAVNTQYTGRHVHALNGTIESAAEALPSAYTLANIPGTPSVASATGSTLTVAFSANNNPSTTEFAIQNVEGGGYVQTNGSLGTTLVWQTLSAWGTSGVVVRNLTPLIAYGFKVKARNGDGIATAFSPVTSGTTLDASVVPSPTPTPTPTPTPAPTSGTTLSYPNGSLVKSGSDATVYLVANDKLLPFPSEAVFHARGQKFENVVTVADSVIAGFARETGVVKHPAGTLLKGSGPDVYVVDSNGNKHHVPSLAAFETLGYSFSRLTNVSDTELATYTSGDALAVSHPDGTLIKYGSSPTVYLVENGTKRPFASATIFLDRGYNFQNVVTSSDAITYPDGNALRTHASGSLVKYGDSPDIYVIDGVLKRKIPSLEVFVSKGYDFADVVTIPGDETYSDGAVVS